MTIEWEAGRLDSELDGVGLDTLAVRAGQRRTPEAEHGEPLFFTSSYVFRSAADAAARLPVMYRAMSIRAIPTRQCGPSKSVSLRWKVPSRRSPPPQEWQRSSPR